MIRLLLFIGILFVASCDNTASFKPPADGYFTKFFGADGDQYAVDMAVDADGSIYILGNSKTPQSGQQIYLAKADAKGTVVWEKYIGKDMDLEARDLEFTSDGNLILVANQQTSANDMDILVRKFTKEGNRLANDSAVLWTKVIVPGASDNSGNAFKNDYVNSITELKDGNFVVVGYTDYVAMDPLNPHLYDVLTIKIDNSFKKMSNPYNETIGAGNINKGAKLLQNRNSFYVFGSSNFSSRSITDSDAWVWSLDSYGRGNVNTDNQTEFIKVNYDEAVSNAVKSFTGYGISSVSSLADNLTLRVIKVLGDSLQFNSKDVGAIKEIPLGIGPAKYSRISNGYGLSNYFVVATYFASGSVTSDIALFKLNDQNLSEEWNHVTFGGLGNDSAAAVEELPDGKILVLGTMQLGNPSNQYKIVLIKVNSNGKLQD